MRPIDADAAADKIMRETENRADDLNMIGIALMIGIAKMLRDENDFPTIEAKPVIYCRDCAFWENKRVSCEGLARCRTGESGYRCRFEYDFCSRAQRREVLTMPYKGSNAEYLNKMNMYELLMLLNERHCIMGTLCEHANQRCTEYDGRCEECIAEWLNEAHK